MSAASRSGKRPTSSWFFFCLVGAVALAISFVASDQLKRLEHFAAVERPARAVLLSSFVKEWTRGDWDAFGTFDVVADGFHGQATGNLLRAGVRRWEPTGRKGAMVAAKVTRAEAEQSRSSWIVGGAYDAFWSPEDPESISFHRVDPTNAARRVFWFRIVGALLVLIGLAVRRRHVRLGSRLSGAGPSRG